MTGALKLTPAQKLGLQFFYEQNVTKVRTPGVKYPDPRVCESLVNKGLITQTRWYHGPIYDLTAEGLAVAALQGW